MTSTRPLLAPTAPKAALKGPRGRLQAPTPHSHNNRTTAARPRLRANGQPGTLSTVLTVSQSFSTQHSNDKQSMAGQNRDPERGRVALWSQTSHGSCGHRTSLVSSQLYSSRSLTVSAIKRAQSRKKPATGVAVRPGAPGRTGGPPPPQFAQQAQVPTHAGVAAPPTSASASPSPGTPPRSHPRSCPC